MRGEGGEKKEKERGITRRMEVRCLLMLWN